MGWLTSFHDDDSGARILRVMGRRWRRSDALRSGALPRRRLRRLLGQGLGSFLLLGLHDTVLPLVLDAGSLADDGLVAAGGDPPQALAAVGAEAQRLWQEAGIEPGMPLQRIALRRPPGTLRRQEP
jgi:hypothetical protein